MLTRSGDVSEVMEGVLIFIAFAVSVFAAVIAIDMYRLLRTGEFGRTWRLLITASVMYALLQMLHLAQTTLLRPFLPANLAQIVELAFALVLAYAFHQQRVLFTRAAQLRPAGEPSEEELSPDTEAEHHPHARRAATKSGEEWDRLSGYDQTGESAPLPERPA